MTEPSCDKKLRQENRKELLDRLEAKIREIDRKFEPSTTFKEGNLIQTDYKKWSEKIQPQQNADWEVIKKMLRGIWGKLRWMEKGYVFNHFRTRFNWNGWSTEDGIALIMAFQEIKKAKP